MSLRSPLCHPLRLWTVCFTQYPGYPAGRWSTDLNTADAMVSAGIEHATELRGTLDRLGLLHFGHYSHLSLVEL